MSKYLLEIGTEELPYRFIPSAINQLKKLFEEFLNDNKVGFNDIKVYATPRRLAVIIDGLEKSSPDEVKIVKGPRLKKSPTTKTEIFLKQDLVLPIKTVFRPKICISKMITCMQKFLSKVNLL